VEFTRRRFGAGTQQVLGAITAVVFIAAAGNQLKAIATVVHSILGIPLVEAAIAIGVIVIAYTIIGGLWAVMVTDVVQFVVLLAVTLLIAPLVLALVPGGLSGVLATVDLSIPPPDGAPSHDLHFLVAGLISFTLGVGSGQGPRFYCVPDERSARKVGRLAAILFLTTPVLFSLPSLAARAAWGGPDVLGDQVPGKDPHERVFIEMAMRTLPAGLVGVFLAAMFAATMSALDSVYNMVASILSRDVYMHFRAETSDRKLIRIGRAMTLLCGAVTIGLCIFYIHGSADLFTVMVNIFYASAPVMAVPVLLGLFFRRAPRAAGMACILWGITTGLITKFSLGWSTGPQIYLTQSMAAGIFLVSPWLGSMWRRRETRSAVVILAVVFAALLAGVLLLGTPEDFGLVLPLGEKEIPVGLSAHGLIALFCGFVLVSIVLFSRRFAAEEERSEVDEFYDRLDTPVDVAAEVTGSSEAALSVFRLVGVVTGGIAALVAVLMGIELLTDPSVREAWWKYVALIAILAALAALFVLSGRRRDRAEAA
jgi:Na+/proline symporter